ncbi:hypothetical protein [Enterococcus sp. CSURQ0835]|uniref:hypothetical protein n=1 Tax=Enterococcus sp. CSURQ0835 TaxID=2681394 RepID=UPI00135C404C|nr:hypothetical protein [Enterococcus sp. CSURQ0835]
MEALNNENTAPKKEQSFDSVKESASGILGGLKDKIQRLEQAMEDENMGEVYQVYWQELPASIQQSTNANHEIDNYLTSKIHRELLKTFPFMILQKKLSPVLMDYRLGDYYRDRSVFEIDATRPKITVLPEVRSQWQKVTAGDYKKQIEQVEEKENSFDAKKLTAQAEVKKLDDQIEPLIAHKTELEQSKTMFNRKKVEDELAEIDEQLDALQEERAHWEPYLSQAPVPNEAQKKEWEAKKHALALEQAVALKELRLIEKRFGSVDKMDAALKRFIADFLNKGVN